MCFLVEEGCASWWKREGWACGRGGRAEDWLRGAQFLEGYANTS